jgi:predicted RNA-binding protein YlqC (UPF0109 family)
MSSSEQYEPGDINMVEPPDVGPVGSDYVPGDVNTVDAGPEGGAEDAGNRAEGGTPVAVLGYLARSLSNEPDAVVIQSEWRQGSIRLRLHVAPEDMGRVIGRRGRTAQAIRTLVGVAGARDGVQTSVDIVDD